MGFNNRVATPLDFNTSPTLPQADSSQAHNIPTGVSPTTAKLQDWIAHLRRLLSGTVEGDVVIAGDLTVGPDLSSVATDLVVSGTATLGPTTYTRVQRTPRTNITTPATSDELVNLGVSEVGSQSIEAPHGAIVTAVSVAILPFADGIMPGTSPTLVLKRRAYATNAVTTLATQVDPTTPAASYEVYHTFSAVLGTPETLDFDTYYYWLELTGEAPGTAQAITWYNSAVTYSARVMSAH